MTQFTINAQDTETSSQYAGDRAIELGDQHWNRDKSEELAQSEGMSLTEKHWAVIVYLRKHYLDYGLPRNARTLSKSLNRQFSALGGSKYLHGLFPGGPITQGSRLGNLRTPSNATDISFGSSY